MEEAVNFSKRIIFVGMPDTAFTTLYYLKGAGLNIVAVVPPPKSNPANEPFVNYAQKMGYTVVSPEDSINEREIISELKTLRADLAVVTSYSEKFSRELLSVTKDGFVNVHPSLLPEYRGANPYSHVIINGEKQTGVTLHKMDDMFDTGDILMQVPVDILNNETMGTLFNKLNRISGEILVQFLRTYEVMGLPEGVKQSTMPVAKHVASKIMPDSGQTLIRWEKSADELERFIRGLNPFLPAGTRYRGIYMKIFTAEACMMKSKFEPGTISAIGRTIDVATGKGVLKIRSLQLGSYFMGDAKDFAERVNLQVGEKLGFVNQ